MTATSESYCSSSSTHYYPAAQQFPKPVYIFACVLITICSFSSTMGNIVILVALRKCQSLHSPSKALLCSLAFTDLFVGLVVLPLFAGYYMVIILEIPTYYCAVAIIYGRASNFVGAVSLATIVTIGVDRYLAFRLRLRYRQVVKLRRIVCILVLEWILAAIGTGSWFLNAYVHLIAGATGILICCPIIIVCYLSIHCGLRRHFAQVHAQASSSESSDFNVVRYKKTVNNMLWIYGLLLVCYMPYLLSMFVILVAGLNNSTRLALHFSAVAIYFNSSLNPILYCWRIKELKEKVTAHLCALCAFILG